MSSISGSESESEEEDLDSNSGGTGSNINSTDNESSGKSSLITGRPFSKAVFQNSEGQYLAVYRCILQGKAQQVQYHPVHDLHVN